MNEDAKRRKKQAEELRDDFIDFKEAMSGEKFEAWRQEKIKEVSEERIHLKDAFQRESRNNVLERTTACVQSPDVRLRISLN
jgi:hypothetical protein